MVESYDMDAKGSESSIVNESPAEGMAHAGRTIDGDLSCVQCGYNLRSLHERGTCPECGSAVRLSLVPVPPKPRIYLCASLALGGAAFPSLIGYLISGNNLWVIGVVLAVVWAVELTVVFLSAVALKHRSYMCPRKRLVVWATIITAGFIFLYTNMCIIVFLFYNVLGLDA